MFFVFLFEVNCQNGWRLSYYVETIEAESYELATSKIALDLPNELRLRTIRGNDTDAVKQALGTLQGGYRKDTEATNAGIGVRMSINASEFSRSKK